MRGGRGPRLGFCANLEAKRRLAPFFPALLLFRSRHCGELNHGSVLFLLQIGAAFFHI